jgi:four helix bundle protein
MECRFRNDSIVSKRANSFALEIIRLYKHLIIEKKEFILSKQVLRSGTSIGANINEALSAIPGETLFIN